MSVDPIPPPARPSVFIHPLLRARDWQDRPEFGELCQWWKDGGFGVCAFVGIGGAGKTAIAERFLQVLPGGYPEHPRVPKDRNLAAPSRLFAFSFYDAPNPDTFFTEVVAWLQGRPPADDLTRLPSYQQTLELLVRAGKSLLVLDGLEKVQDDGSRGGALGQILDGRLRDFVLRAADGWLPQMSLLITSRVRLFDPLAKRTYYYKQIKVEQLQPPAAVQLLRDRGVRGTDKRLEQVAREQGFHALSVDLVGGYIARFYGGNSWRFSFRISTWAKLADIADPTLDPRVAALCEQERKFARLSERYHKALAKRDPAALALLQRICLFRMGVEAKTLASIFTGEGKRKISGRALACLNEQQLEATLQLLVEMRLVEAFTPQISSQKSEIYSVHPAVRDCFLKKLHAETVRLGHDAVRQGLAALLGGQPGRDPSDATTLDLLEEIVYQTLAAGRTEEAWNIYCKQVGAFGNLGWILGAYERGERICRAFAFSQRVGVTTLHLSQYENNEANFTAEWALYLKSLGQLTQAARCYERVVEVRTRQENWINASRGNQNLAHMLLLTGRLKAGLRAGEESLRLAFRLEDATLLWEVSGIVAFIFALRSNIEPSLDVFRGTLRFQHMAFPMHEHRTLWSLNGVWNALVLGRLGRNDEATQDTYRNLESLSILVGFDNAQASLCKLLLSDLAQECGALADARRFLREAHEWALQRDAKEELCWAAQVRAKLEIAAFDERHSASRVEARASLTRAASALEDGLRIVRDCGYGIYHIDLLLVRARLALYEGRAIDAERDVRVALDEGVHPSTESGFPELLAATDPECLYVWGIAEGRQLLAEALLLQAAQKLGEEKFLPDQSNRLPADVRDLIARAREQLDQALELWRKLRDPESEADINPKGERTRRVLEGLAGGVLTEYPLVTDTAPTPSAILAATPQEPTVATSSASVFVCYAQADNKPSNRWLDRLLEHLAPLVRQEDLAVWSDQQLKVGDEWNPEIQKQLEAAKVVVLLVSPAFLASTYIANSELPVVLKRRSEEGLKILPVLLSPSLYDKTRFKWPDPKTGPEEFTLSSLQAAGSPKKTLSEMTGPQRNRAFVALAERILEIVGANP